MTELIAPNYANNSARTKGEMKQVFEDLIHISKEQPGGGPRTILTLVSDTVAIPDDTCVLHIAAQTGTADTINTLTGNTRDGRIVLLRADTGDQITITHNSAGSGKFILLDSTSLVINDKSYVMFIYNEASTQWEEIYRDSIRTPGGAARSTLTLDVSGYATPTGFQHLIDTYASAASDNCDRLVTTNKVPLVLVRPANVARVVTLRHNQGGDGSLNNFNGDNITFSNALQAVLYERNGTVYDEVMRYGFGPQELAPELKTAAFTAEWGKTYFCTASSGNYSITMPTAASAAGRTFRVMRTAGTGVISFGGTGFAIYSTQQMYTVYSDGTNFRVTAQVNMGQEGSGDRLPYFVASNGVSWEAYQPAYSGATFGFELGGSTVIPIPVIPTASAEQTVATSTQVGVNHSLGRRPYDWDVVLRCKTAEGGYAVGDEVRPNPDGGTANRGMSTWANATQVGCSTSATIEITPKGGGNLISVTPAKWRWVFYWR